jgi:hypothetical protein
MSAHVLSQDNKSRFCFQGIAPNAELETKANAKLSRLLALAPPGAQAVGKLERTGSRYARPECRVPSETPFACNTATRFPPNYGSE